MKKLVMVLALFFGVACGSGAGFFLDTLNSAFMSPKELQEKLNIPVLSSIPLVSDTDLELNGRMVTPSQLCLVKPLSRYSESIRSLRTGIELADVDSPPQVVMVTSALPKDGKTTVSTSLAMSAAHAGIRTLLVDCDLRRPTVSQNFRIENTPGLLDLLLRHDNPEKFVHRYPGALSVMSAGSTKTQSPPDVLGSSKMRDLIATFRGLYDFVVIDTPPLGPVIDSVVISRLVDKAIMVVRFGHTPRELVSGGVAAFSNDKVLAGVVLNMIDERQVSRYGRYAYYNQKYYGSYYTE